MQLPVIAVSITTLLFCSFFEVVSALSISTEFLAVMRSYNYSTNALCSKKNCINPIFPGMEDLSHLEKARWLSSSLTKTLPHLGFCKNAINYDPALPLPVTGDATLEYMAGRQDNAAATMYYFHLSGLGLDAWDYTKPEWSSNDCISSIWRMACYTYFPRAQVGVPEGAIQNYIRPCQSSCQNYVRACGVQCCDESVQCVFSHTSYIKEPESREWYSYSTAAQKLIKTQGYEPHDGPSSLCTGASHRSATPLSSCIWGLVMMKVLFSIDAAAISSGFRSMFAGRRRLAVLTSIALAASLQGCADVPIHRVANWRAEPDYLVKGQFIPPGGSSKLRGWPTFDDRSCASPRLSPALQCNGRGTCIQWDPTNYDNKLAFCRCDTYWADAECRTKRKSQAVAYILSIFFGIFGADQFYLGFAGLGVAKLLTLGGLGTWWIYDIVRIGSAPVYSSNVFRTAADLPHLAYVTTCSMFAILLGFIVAYHVTVFKRNKKRLEAMTLQLDEESSQFTAKAFNKPFVNGYGPGALPCGKMHIPGHKPVSPIILNDLEEANRLMPGTMPQATGGQMGQYA